MHPRKLQPRVETLEDRFVPTSSVVNSLLDTAAPPAGTVTLRSAILASEADTSADTITFSPSILGGTIVLTSDLPTITRLVDIQGPGENGLIVCGNRVARCFVIGSGGLAAISGLTLTQGNAAADGGAILNNGILTLANVTISDSKVTGSAVGGGVATEGTGTLTATNCTIFNNSASAAGGVFLALGATATLTDCTISGNIGTGTSGSGAGICSLGTLTVVSGQITQNRGAGASFQGGGLFSNNSLAASNVLIANNFAGGSGGGAYVLANGSVKNCTIAFNLCTGAQGGGGLVFNSPSNPLTVINCTITGNTDANTGSQAAGGLSVQAGTLTLHNSVIADNQVTAALTPAPDARGPLAATSSSNLIGIGTAQLTGITGGNNGNQIGTVVAPLDPLLGPLQDNGGPTLSRAPLTGSLLLNTGNDTEAAGISTDQRGGNRVVGSHVDIGAVEFQPADSVATLIVVPSGTIALHRPITLQASVAGLASGPNNVPDGFVTFFNGTNFLGNAPLDSSGNASITVNTLPAGTNALRVTFNGDGLFNQSSSAVTNVQVLIPTSTVGTVDPSTETWYLRNSNSPGAPDIAPFTFGAPGWVPLSGDWDGDGKNTIGVFNPATATFYLRNTNSGGAPSIAPFVFGAPGWVPLVGDWDGDGKTSIGVFDPGTATFYLRNSNNGGPADAGLFAFGGAGWKPVTSDWDANGTTTIGVFSPGGGWYLKNVNDCGTPDITPFAFGAGSWTPVVGDWNGDSVFTVGAVDPGTGVWYLRNGNVSGAPDFAPFAYGAGSWKPVAGDWNFPALPLKAADGGLKPTIPFAPLTKEELQPLVQAALTRLKQAGVKDTVLAQLASARIETRDLGAGMLGLTYRDQNTIYLDDDGAGHGWFRDPTPLEDVEFAGFKYSPAQGRMDVLSVIEHEFANLAGLTENDGSTLMTDTLAAGQRNLADLGAAFARYGLTINDKGI